MLPVTETDANKGSEILVRQILDIHGPETTTFTWTMQEKAN